MLPHPLLMVDASTPWIHAGVLGDGAWLALRRERGDALEAVFRLAAAALEDADTSLGEIAGFVHCEGPGGLLGLRLSAMAVRTWRVMPELRTKPLWTYGSLEMAQAIARATSRDEPAPTVISPFRRGSFCVWRDGRLEIVDDAAVATLPGPKLFIPQRFIRQAPGDIQVWEYDLTPLPQAVAQASGLLRRSEVPHVCVPEESEYQLWTGDRHRG